MESEKEQEGLIMLGLGHHCGLVLFVSKHNGKVPKGFHQGSETL